MQLIPYEWLLESFNRLPGKKPQLSMCIWVGTASQKLQTEVTYLAKMCNAGTWGFHF